MAVRKFEFSEGGSNKFWNIALDGSSYMVHFGRIGTAGQSQMKSFATADAAKKSYDKLIAEKTGKGYREVGKASGGAASAQPSKAAAAMKSAAVKSSTAKSSPAAKTATPAKPSATKPASVSAKADNATTEPVLELNPEDWMWATYLPRSPKTRPAPLSFKRDAALAKVESFFRAKYNFGHDWSRLRLPHGISREEGLFWFSALIADRGNGNLNGKELGKILRKVKVPEDLSADEVMEQLFPKEKKVESYAAGLNEPQMIMALTPMFSPVEIASFLLDRFYARDGKMKMHKNTISLLNGFREYVIPYMTDEEIAAVRKMAVAHTDISNFSPTQGFSADPAWLMASYTGAHKEMLMLVESWKDNVFEDEEPVHIFQLVYGLGSGTLVEKHVRRLKLSLLTRGEFRTELGGAGIRGLLAHTGTSALDYIRDQILFRWAGTSYSPDAQDRLLADKATETLGLMRSKKTAVVMLEIMSQSKSPLPARQWLDENPAYAIAGLVPIAEGKGPFAEHARDYLRTLERAGHKVALTSTSAEPASARKSTAAKIEADLREYPAFDDKSTPKWLHSAVAELEKDPKSKKPMSVGAKDLPVLVVDSHRLNADQVQSVLAALRLSTPSAPHALAAAIRQHASAASRDTFAWELFQYWLRNGNMTPDKWQFAAMGSIAGDGVVMKLAPLIRQWPGESQHARAVLGLEILRAIGSDVALMQISRIAAKLPFKGLKAKAAEMMEGIATDRGMTRPELEDRIVTTCELDDRGTRTFDFGSRKFQFVLGPDMKPMVRDESGHIKPDLPKPGGKDDTKLAAQSTEDWKLLKKQIREVILIQSVRLEQAMVTGRRWNTEGFEQLLVNHPLMTHLARLLVWGAFSKDGTLKKTFRITEDRTCADEKDRDFSLSGIAQVGIVHPLQLSDETKKNWMQVVGDYKIIAPFKQLDRETFALAKDEQKQTSITRFAKLILPATAIVAMEKSGWERGIPQDAGMFHEHCKPFYGSNVTAVMTYDYGIGVGMIHESDDQHDLQCSILNGIYTPREFIYRASQLKGMALSKVDPVVLSEVLRDLTTVAARGK